MASHNCKGHIFESASGDSIVGYPTTCRNVVIGGVQFRRFHYYLIPSFELRKFLLGKDFISCCKFEHAVDGDITVTEFSNGKYEQQASNAIDMLEILELVSNVSAESNVFT